MSVISGSEAVENYISLNLVKIATDKSGWDSLYLNATSNQYWICKYKNAGMHGGGQPELKQVTELLAKKEFGV
ncbi:Imm27 family immunity protein [Colwelliaceae bacterium MEBiC 14330]